MDLDIAAANAIAMGNAPSPHAAAASASQSGAASALIGGVGKDDFLKLLVAQLRNQDPMKPMEDKEFIAQMAQLNTVEQVANMNVKLSEMLSFQAMAQASNLIGKLVEAEPAGFDPIIGIVRGVIVADNAVKVVVDNREVELADIRAIAPGQY